MAHGHLVERLRFEHAERNAIKILIAGNMGYLGPVVVRHLRKVFPYAALVGLDIECVAHCGTMPNVIETIDLG